jgi:HEPN domain-containing protein
MPLDDARVAAARAWFYKSKQDLRCCAADMAAEPPLLEDVLFHSQQAAEKAMKGLLAWHDRPFAKTHDLRRLVDVCLEVEPGLGSVLLQSARLSDYASRFRYPGEPYEPTPEETGEACRIAGEVCGAILGCLPDAVRP